MLFIQRIDIFRTVKSTVHYELELVNFKEIDILEQFPNCGYVGNIAGKYTVIYWQG